MSEHAIAATPANDATEPSAKEKVLGNAANEIVFAVVGHVGSGTSEIAVQLRLLLMQGQLPGGAFDAEIIKARDVIEEWATGKGLPVPKTRNDVTTTIALQDLGDKMRATTPDYGAVAEAIARRIRTVRASKRDVTPGEREAVLPDGKPRAYIVDSIRHPQKSSFFDTSTKTRSCSSGLYAKKRSELSASPINTVTLGKMPLVI